MPEPSARRTSPQRHTGADEQCRLRLMTGRGSRSPFIPEPHRRLTSNRRRCTHGHQAGLRLATNSDMTDPPAIMPGDVYDGSTPDLVRHTGNPESRAGCRSGLRQRIPPRRSCYGAIPGPPPRRPAAAPIRVICARAAARDVHPVPADNRQGGCASADSTCKAGSSRYVTALTRPSAVRQVGAKRASAVLPRGPQFPHKSAAGRRPHRKPTDETALCGTRRHGRYDGYKSG